jgi:hypothetical protein
MTTPLFVFLALLLQLCATPTAHARRASSANNATSIFTSNATILALKSNWSRLATVEVPAPFVPESCVNYMNSLQNALAFVADGGNLTAKDIDTLTAIPSAPGGLSVALGDLALREPSPLESAVDI